MLCVSSNILSKVDQLHQDHVVIRDVDQLNDKLNILVAGKADKLQIIADFDSTLTKSIVDGKPTPHSLEIFASAKSLSKKYRDGCKALEAKYGPKVSREKTEEELQRVYDQWWDDHEILTAGENITLKDIEEAVDSINTPLRDGCTDMFNLLSKHQVPVVVLSAGLGEVVNYKLRDFKPTVISNFIRMDDSGKILGFTKPTVSVYNKHKMSIPVEKVRENAILIGDSLGDAIMADSVSNIKTILKIGFFIGLDQVQLQKYCNSFDVVVINDQTMNTVNAVLRLILDSS
ncbi:cytosolic 5'-nucleotidase 3-like [Macrosteles quadrilineatus]|uniref:cytosolic 5'-nucleotidase 3-like n=1 Tax=Macrosteles quadrilineatus TaxID=74068 RepID=UPI0023E32F37|nr:cytosolic 5'-nucleotidase 3-like [Macrosteles quadrilineatus]XP_054267837.1 cytosolic 5'-nucleotidase 3-like [Macrosteles quadrilineatus]XP_054267838.1 cytosolic 5'-nucleotidase 3-like [Macrosteles quadrilineatus]